MKNSDCLPCPCCGGYAAIHHGKQYKMMFQDWHTADEASYQPCSIDCTVCGLKITRAACNAEHGGADGAYKESERTAVSAWNNRPDTGAKPTEEPEPGEGDVVAELDQDGAVIGGVFQWEADFEHNLPANWRRIVLMRRAEVEARVKHGTLTP